MCRKNGPMYASQGACRGGAWLEPQSSHASSAQAASRKDNKALHPIPSSTHTFSLTLNLKKAYIGQFCLNGLLGPYNIITDDDFLRV